jgi:hypothetical protein
VELPEVFFKHRLLDKRGVNWARLYEVPMLLSTNPAIAFEGLLCESASVRPIASTSTLLPRGYQW